MLELPSEVQLELSEAMNMDMLKGIVHPELKLHRFSVHPDVDRGSDDIF